MYSSSLLHHLVVKSYITLLHHALLSRPFAFRLLAALDMAPGRPFSPMDRIALQFFTHSDDLSAKQVDLGHTAIPNPQQSDGTTRMAPSSRICSSCTPDVHDLLRAHRLRRIAAGRAGIPNTICESVHYGVASSKIIKVVFG